LGLARLDYAEADRLGMDGRAAACLAYMLTLASRDEEAIAVGQRAIQHGFVTAELYNNLAYSQMQRARFKDADESLCRALDLDPRLPAVHHNRLWLLRRDLSMDQKREARLSDVSDLLAKAFDGAPESFELHEDAADVCALAGQRDDVALTHLEKAVHLGLVLWPEDAVLRQEREKKPYFRYYYSLHTHPRFQALRDLPPISPGPQGTRRLCDPVADRDLAPDR
jgi:tetratricopeptide (TPR) repeat protein